MSKVTIEKYRDKLRENLAGFESINGIRLTPEEFRYIIKVAELNGIFEIPPRKASDFSKPKNFFLQHRQKCSLVFIKKGSWIPVYDIENEHEHFLAYLLDKKTHTMILYGYYPEEAD